MVFDQFETVSCSSSPAAANLLYLPGAGYWFSQNRLANDRQYQRSRHASTVSSPSCWIACVNIPPYSCPTSPWRAACLKPVLPPASQPGVSGSILAQQRGCTAVKMALSSSVGILVGFSNLSGKLVAPRARFPWLSGIHE